jgi:hypothetical protein
MRLLLGDYRGGAVTPVRFRTMIDKLVVASTPAAQAGAISESFDVSIDDLDGRIHAFHSRIYHGVGKTPARTALAVTLTRAARPPLRVAPDNRRLIHMMCSALRARNR